MPPKMIKRDYDRKLKRIQELTQDLISGGYPAGFGVTARDGKSMVRHSHDAYTKALLHEEESIFEAIQGQIANRAPDEEYGLPTFKQPLDECPVQTLRSGAIAVVHATMKSGRNV